MGTLTDSLFTVLMSWVRALVNAFWALFSSDHTTALEFLGKNWLMIAVVIIAAGLVVDWIIWLLRWQPYHLWAQRARRLLRLDAPEDDEEEQELRAHAAVTRSHRVVREEEQEAYDPAYDLQDDDPAGQQHEDEFPPRPFEPEEERKAMERAQSVPDADLGAYPGMRYDSAQAGRDMGGTRRYPVMHTQQGPGAAEVERRRAEIDAWQLQMQEEARARAQAEQEARLAQEAYEAEQARLAQEAYEAEQARLAQEAYKAEQARLAQEAYEAEQARLAQEAYEAEQARLAQEEYQRQLAEYERQKAQYERDLAEYERQKAEYEEQLAMQEAAQQEQPATRRRRASHKSYSDYVQGDTVSELPDAPQWPQMEHTASSVRAQKAAHEEKGGKDGLLGKVARMIEPEEEELVSRRMLPPRVDPNEAFHTAKLPVIGGKRRR